MIPLFNGTSLLRFKPRRGNTQLVRGEADVDTETGRIISCTLHGEYDMINFTVEMVMNEEKPLSLTPHICTVRGNFKFLGNLVAGLYHVHFGLSAPDSTLLTNPHDHRIMGVLRPDSLPLADRQIFMEVYRRQEAADSLEKNEGVKEKKRDLKYYLWNVIGDNVVNSVKSHFGNNNQGYVRLNPILNPLYMGYDHKRGFIYKFDIRASYLPTANRELSLRVKAGYSFKQRQLYYQIPFSSTTISAETDISGWRSRTATISRTTIWSSIYGSSIPLSKRLRRETARGGSMSLSVTRPGCCSTTTSPTMLAFRSVGSTKIIRR